MKFVTLLAILALLVLGWMAGPGAREPFWQPADRPTPEAAALLRRALKARQPASPSVSDELLTVARAGWREASAELERYLEANESAFAILADLEESLPPSGRLWERADLDWERGPEVLPSMHSNELQELGWGLLSRARQMQRLGEHAAALEHCLATITFAQRVGYSPLSDLIARDCARPLVDQALMILLQLSDHEYIRAGQWAEVLGRLEALEAERGSLSQAYRQERAMQRYELQLSDVGSAFSGMQVDGDALGELRGLDVGLAEAMERAELAADPALFLEAQRGSPAGPGAEALSEEYWAAKLASDQAHSAVDWSEMILSDRLQLTRARLLRVAVAARLFDQRSEQPLRRLEQLVPEFLSHVPSDPFDSAGAKLRMSAGRSGTTFYSIGPDREDQDGQLTLDPGNGWSGDVLAKALVLPPGVCCSEAHEPNPSAR